MIEITGDFWDHAQDYDVLVVPTNVISVKHCQLKKNIFIRLS